MAIPRAAWEQLRNRTASELIWALRADGWEEDLTRGATRVFRNSSGRRVVIHYHPKKTYGAKLLKALIEDIGWMSEDLKRLKLVK